MKVNGNEGSQMELVRGTPRKSTINYDIMCGFRIRS